MTDRDMELLALLERDDRSKIEEVVNEIIDESLPADDPIYLWAAAMSFDQRAESLPDTEKVVAWQIAAALRARASPGARTH